MGYDFKSIGLLIKPLLDWEYERLCGDGVWSYRFEIWLEMLLLFPVTPSVARKICRNVTYEKEGVVYRLSKRKVGGFKKNYYLVQKETTHV